MGRKRSRKTNKKTSKKFNDLNDDVMCEIFDYLDPDSVKNAMEVCKKWNKIIGESSSSWRKFKFVVPDSWETSKVVIQKISRPVTTVEFKNLFIGNTEICDVLKKFNMQFKVMIFDNVDIDAEIFKKLISMFQLDKLVMNEIIIKSKHGEPAAKKFHPSEQDHPTGESTSDTSNDDAEKVVGMIAIVEPSMEPLNILTNLKLQCKKLVVNIEKKDVSYIEYRFARPFANFMTHQRNLKEFVIKTSTANGIMRFLIEPLKQSKLGKLAIRLVTDTNLTSAASQSELLAELIRSQPALKEIEICCLTISQNVIRAIYQTENLQKLLLAVDDVEDLLKSSEFPIPNVPHANLKTFIMKESPSQRALDALMKMFANIETLAIFVDNSNGLSSDLAGSAEILLTAQNRLRLLKYLRIVSVMDDFLAVNIPSMQKFQVESVRSFAGLRSFLAQNPLLQELELEAICDLPESLQLPTELVNLQKLTIGGSDGGDEFEINEEVLRDLKTSCPKLTRVDVGADGVYVADDIADFSAIKIAKFDQSSSKNVFEKLTLTAFNGKKDLDLKCIWLKNDDSSHVESDGCDCSACMDNFMGESFSEEGEEEEFSDDVDPDEEVEDEEEEDDDE